MFTVSTRIDFFFWAILWLLNVWCLQRFWAIPALYITAANATLPVGAVPYSSSNPLMFGLSLDANLTSFRCYGSELHLLRCIHSAGSCSRYNTAGVLCYGDVVPGLWQQSLFSCWSTSSLLLGIRFFISPVVSWCKSISSKSQMTIKIMSNKIFLHGSWLGVLHLVYIYASCATKEPSHSLSFRFCGHGWQSVKDPGTGSPSTLATVSQNSQQEEKWNPTWSWVPQLKPISYKS